MLINGASQQSKALENMSLQTNSLINKILLVLILIIALGLRVYKLDLVPPSISWDEAAVGYNAWTIANYGRDEYGNFFPLYFRSFADDKHPVHIYLTAVSVKFLGLSEFSTRLPSALFGVLNVLLIFLLTNLLFRNRVVSLFAATFLAISPQNIHFSRFNHEANFALFFFLFGLTLFYLSLKKKMILLPLSIISFCLSFLAYHPAKLIVPITMMFLFTFYFRQIRRKFLFASLIIILLFGTLIFLNPPLLGLARISQNSIGEGKNLLQKIALYATQYSWHFSPSYLFISGDKNPRLSSQSTGEFYKIEAIFLTFGLIYLLRKRSREAILVLIWAAIAPIPSALAAEAPHGARSMFMMGSWNIISALGLYSIVSMLHKKIIKWIVMGIITVVIIYSLLSYLSYYFGEYAKRYAIDWQYGMKQIVEFVKQHNEYSSVSVTDIRSQPYIFFLFYLKLPLQDYLRNMIYNNNIENRSYNNVASFNRFSFGGWDPIESLPKRDVLYVVTPSQYDGLRHKSLFDVKKVIYYPNGAAAFYLVSEK